MKNRLSDLNDHLFMQLERLANEDLTSEQIDVESKRAESMVSVADQIIRNAGLQISMAKLVATHGAHMKHHLPQIEGKKE